MTARALSILKAHPFTARFIGIVVVTGAALLVNYHQDTAGNTELGTAAAISIVVLGLSWLTGWSGQISIGNSGFMAFGGYAVGIWAAHHTSLWIGLAILMAAIAGALSGLILAIPGTRLKGPYLAGLTLAFATLVPQITYFFSSWTGGPNAQITFRTPVAPLWFSHLFSGQLGFLQAQTQWSSDAAILTAGLCFLIMANLFRSPTGRMMRLVRDDEVAAELAGVNLARARTLAFVIAASFGGIGGGLIIMQVGNITPSSFALTISITLLTVMVLGGMGTLAGAALGGLLYVYAQSFVAWLEGATGISTTSNLGTQLKGILFSALLIATMLLAPMGIWGSLRLGTHRLIQRRRQPH